MNKSGSNFERKSVDSLRNQAEEQLHLSSADISNMPMDDVKKLVHELQVHQIELQLQNEELRETQLSLAESRDRYTDLYEFVPVGYLTLTLEGVIREANLTASVLLRCERSELIGYKLTEFVSPESQDTLYLC